MTTDITTPAPAFLDLDSLDLTAAAEEGSEMMVRHPVTDEELGWSILLAGRDSAAWAKAVEAVNKRNQGKRLSKLTHAESLDRRADLVSRVSLGFPRGNPIVGGEEIPFSRENVRKLYRRFGWLVEQADEHMSDRAQYLQD
jgi:hypothetical protein